MRVVFFGSPEPAVTTLTSLVEAGHDVALVVTTPPHRRHVTPVEAEATKLGLTVSYDPNDAMGVHAELGVLMAYGRLLKRPLLDSLEIINVHPSLLPQWRGASPVEASILAGETTTGVSLMRLTMGMDEGPLYAQVAVKIPRDTSADELILQLVARGNELLDEIISESTRTTAPQQGEPTYCGKLTTEDFRIDVSRSAEEQYRWLRIAPIWCVIGGKRLRVRAAQVVSSAVDRANNPGTEGESPAQAKPTPGTLLGDELHFAKGSLRLETVQYEGRAAQTFAAWRNGIQQKGALHVQS